MDKKEIIEALDTFVLSVAIFFVAPILLITFPIWVIPYLIYRKQKR